MKKITLISIIFLMFSCEKEEPVELTPSVYGNGVLTLNEGLFQQNNASISFYSNVDQTASFQQFLAVNERGLGDTANDWVTFEENGNTFIAIAVDVSSQIEIVDAKSLISVQQIPMFDGMQAKEPRRIAVTANKIYCANYDGTLTILNRGSLAEIATINVGQNPDGLAIKNDKVYVSNSGGLNGPQYDSTITVIDANTDNILQTFKTRINCTGLIAGLGNNLYLNSRGNYTDVDPAMLHIDAVGDSVISEYPINISSWDMESEWLYYVDADLNGVYRYNTSTNTFENNQIIDCSSLNTPYKIAINDDHIYLADANGYVNSSTIKVYDKQGLFKYEFTAGLNTTDFIFND